MNRPLHVFSSPLYLEIKFIRGAGEGNLLFPSLSIKRRVDMVSLTYAYETLIHNPDNSVSSVTRQYVIPKE